MANQNGRGSSRGCPRAEASQAGASDCPTAWFQNMVRHCLDHVEREQQQNRRLVGILCEYTPRELILAADAIPVCLCGGSEKMIAPAEEHLPANLCPVVKSTYGYDVANANPFLRQADLIVAETTCDGKKKMYELLAERHPMHVVELPQKADDPDAREHWFRELQKLRRALETRFEVEITDARLREAIRAMNEERGLRRRLAELLKVDNPPLTGRELLDLKSLISCQPEDLEQYRRGLELLPQRGLEPPAASRVRVLLTGVPLPHGAEHVMDLIEGSGGLVVCQENCTGLKPLVDDVDAAAADPLRAIADKYFHLPCSVMTTNERRFDLLRTLAAQYRAECVIELVWQACLTYDVEAYHTRRLVESELGLHYLRIQTDFSRADSARIALRVQALFETVRSVA